VRPVNALTFAPTASFRVSAISIRAVRLRRAFRIWLIVIRTVAGPENV